MKKRIAAFVSAVFAVSMVSTAFADDVSVRTSIGSGEVIFTETSEEADISAEELTGLVKDGIRSLSESEAFNAFLDAEVSFSLKLDEENELSFSGSAIGELNQSGDDKYASFTYFLEGLGDPQEGRHEAYHWSEDDKHYTAHSDGSGWTVEVEDSFSEALEQLTGAMESEEVDQVSLNGLLPNLYEENGEKYYVCLYDKDTLLGSFDSVEEAEMYTPVAESLLGDNDLQLVVIVNAETGFLRAVSLDASGAQDQIPGELLGMEGALDYSADDLYVTLLLDTSEQTIEIPEEVLNTPVSEEEASGLDLDSLLSGLGLGEEAE